MKKVFLWYPRRVWQFEDGELVNYYMWLTWATDYSPAWHWPQRVKNFWMRNRPQFLKNRPRKFKPFPPFNPNAHQEFLEKWPHVDAFVIDQRPICPDVRQKYNQLYAMLMVRRVMPNLIAHELVGVQPMTAPVGQIFTMRYKYNKETENA